MTCFQSNGGTGTGRTGSRKAGRRDGSQAGPQPSTGAPWDAKSPEQSPLADAWPSRHPGVQLHPGNSARRGSLGLCWVAPPHQLGGPVPQLWGEVTVESEVMVPFWNWGCPWCLRDCSLCLADAVHLQPTALQPCPVKLKPSWPPSSFPPSYLLPIRLSTCSERSTFTDSQRCPGDMMSSNVLVWSDVHLWNQKKIRTPGCCTCSYVYSSTCVCLHTRRDVWKLPHWADNASHVLWQAGVRESVGDTGIAGSGCCSAVFKHFCILSFCLSRRAGIRIEIWNSFKEIK